MIASQRRDFSFGWLLFLAVVLGCAAFLVPARSLHIYWLSVGGAALLLLYAVRGNLLTAILVWFFTLICLHEEFWRMTVPFFFAITIPRLLIVVLVVLMVMMLALGRLRVNAAWPISAAMLALAVYFTVSAVVTGFDTRSPVTVHYRLIGGYLFPFTVFGLMVHSVRKERDLWYIAVFFLIISIYLTFTGWMEYFKVWALVWPRFIADPNVGIHWGRVRGPFVMSAAMGLSLVYCYFNNLALARHVRGFPRWFTFGVNALMLPTIFWTKTRSVWLAFLLCAVIWVLYSRRRSSRMIWVAVLVTLGSVTSIVNMENFLSQRREKGGFLDVEPMLLRIGLAQISGEMVLHRPLTGVGFGHFRDYAPSYARDPSSPYFAFATTALEHNNFLSILAETGLLGLALYLLVMYLTVRPSLSLYRKLPKTAVGFINRDLIVLYWILTVAYLIDGMLRETSDNPFANCLFFGLSGVIVALNSLLGPHPLEIFEPRAGDPPLGPTLEPTAQRPAPARPAGPVVRPAAPSPPSPATPATGTMMRSSLGRGASRGPTERGHSR